MFFHPGGAASSNLSFIQESSSSLRGSSEGRRILKPSFQEPCILTSREEQVLDKTPGGPKGKHGQTSWTCELRGQDANLLGHSFVEVKGISDEYFAEQGVISGATTLSVQGAIIEGSEMTIPDGAVPSLDIKPPTTDSRRGRNRRLAEVEGEKSILVVRVTANDRSTTGSEVRLAEAVFTDTVCLKSQFSACSHGKLNFVPATGNSVTNGVTTVQINAAVGGQAYKTVEGLIETAVNEQFGTSVSSLYDHVMFCVPPGTAGGW
jgi:hypothetical protein